MDRHRQIDYRARFDLQQPNADLKHQLITDPECSRYLLWLLIQQAVANVNRPALTETMVTAQHELLEQIPEYRQRQWIIDNLEFDVDQQAAWRTPAAMVLLRVDNDPSKPLGFDPKQRQKTGFYDLVEQVFGMERYGIRRKKMNIDGKNVNQVWAGLRFKTAPSATPTSMATTDF